MPVLVVNRHEWKGSGTWIGRTRDPKDGVFGNPYSHMDGTLAKYKVDTREEAIEKYRDYMYDQWANNEYFRLALTHFVKRHLRGETVVLACVCKPKPCHGDLLKEFIEQLADLGVVTLDDEQDQVVNEDNFKDVENDLPF